MVEWHQASTSINIDRICLFGYLWHYEGGALSRRSFCLFWRETKQTPELEISMQLEVCKGTPEKEMERGTQRRELAKGDAGGGAVDNRQQKRLADMR